MRSANRPHRSAPRASMMDAWVASVSSFARTKCWLSQRLSDFGTSQRLKRVTRSRRSPVKLIPSGRGKSMPHSGSCLAYPTRPDLNGSSSPKRRRGPRRPALPLAPRCSTSVSRGGARAQAWRNTLYTFARARFVKGPRPHHLDTPAAPPLCVCGRSGRVLAVVCGAAHRTLHVVSPLDLWSCVLPRW